MANWCDTQITIFDENVDKLKELYENINKWTSKEYSKSGFGESWLGNVVIGSGIATYDEEKRIWIPDVSCRGGINNIQFNEQDKCIFITQEDAWGPNYEIWQDVLAKYLPNAQLIVTAVEPGCELYGSNDPTIIGNYNVDIWNDDNYPELNDFEPEWCIDEVECIDTLKLMLQKKHITLDKDASVEDYIQKVDEIYPDCVYIHQWEELDI